MTQLLTFIFLMIVTNAFNKFPSTPSPRYWNNSAFDSLIDVAVKNAAHKTDSALGVNVYLSDMRKLNQDLK